MLCAPTHKINHRGDTLGGINLTVEITTPMPEVIRVKTYHYKGAIQDECTVCIKSSQTDSN